MKTLIVSLVALLFAFFIGCQENSITDPAAENSSSGTEVSNTLNIDKDILSYYYKDIKIDNVLYDPSHPLNSNAKIYGTVRYRIDDLKIDKSNLVKVGLYVNATLKGGCTLSKKAWTVNCTREAIVDVSNTTINDAKIFEKAFGVCNCCCHPLKLVIKFELNDDRALNVVSMRLELAEVGEPIGDPSF